MFKNLSIRIKFLLILLSFTVFALALTALTANYYEQKEKITSLKEALGEIEVDVLSAFKSQNDFIIHETIEDRFFTTGESRFVKQNDSISMSVLKKLKKMAFNPTIKDLGLKDDFLELKTTFYLYKTTFDTLVEVTLERGYKDYGLEGRMRDFAHALEEEYEGYVDEADVLMLRRHEKDFIIRKEEKYISRFEARSELIKYKLSINDKVGAKKREEILQILKNYEEVFEKLVESEKSIGLKEFDGLKAQVDRNAQVFLTDIRQIKSKVVKAQGPLIIELQIYYGISVFLFVLIIVFGSISVSRRMTRNLKSLSTSMNAFVRSNFKKPTNGLPKAGKDEVGELTRNFKALEDEIVIHFAEFRERVKIRTDEILDQKELLEKKQTIIERKNKDILDSIKYAKKIQDSVLPRENYIKQLLGGFFIYYLPKDIVSGDFYWVERQSDKVFIAVADCTGHGVPGAFMSIMGHTFLNQAVNEKNITKPDQILNYVNVAILSTLRQEENNWKGKNIREKSVQDGMDIALITIDFSTNELLFSGAQRPLLVARENDLLELKGDRYPVGGVYYQEIKRFSLKKLQLRSNDNLFMFSDGYGDQFGGSKSKKFKYTKLRELLYTIRKETPQTQKTILEEAHEAWKGDNDQVDDICVLGLKI